MGADLEDLKRTIDRALGRYGAWERPLRRYRAEEYRRLNADGFTWEMYQDGLAKLEAKLIAEHDPRAELHPLFERLCGVYLNADDAVRGEIRAWVEQSKRLGNLLWRYANFLTGLVGAKLQAVGTCEDELVNRSLAAISVENSSANYRDTLMTLADLYVATEKAGVDPRPLFAAAAAWSTDEFTPGGCASLAATMREFHASSVLRERRGMTSPYGGPT